MNESQVNPTPKKRFLDIKDADKAHHAILENPYFQRGEDYALLEYERKLAKHLGASTNPQVDGMIVAWKLTGAREFLSEFHTLAEKEIEAQRPGVGRVLNHEA